MTIYANNSSCLLFRCVLRLSIVHISFSLPDIRIGVRLSPNYGGSKVPKIYLNLLKADLWVIDRSCVSPMKFLF